MSIAANVAEIIRIDNRLEELRKERVVPLSVVSEFKWLKQQRSDAVGAIQNYTPPSASTR